MISTAKLIDVILRMFLKSRYHSSYTFILYINIFVMILVCICCKKCFSGLVNTQ